MTYSTEQLKAMCPLSISECSQKHVQSVVAELIETALAQPATMFNGLTEAETGATASVFGLVGAQQASVPAPLPAPEYSHCDADYSVGHGVGYVQGWNACIEAMLAAAPAAPQPEAQPPGFALVQIAELTKWKSLANSLAVLSLKSERATTAIILKSLIQDAIDAAPSAQAEPTDTAGALMQQIREVCAATLKAGPGVAVPMPDAVRSEMQLFMRGEPNLIERLPFCDVVALSESEEVQALAAPSAQAEPIAALVDESERLGLYDVPPLAELREKLGGWDVPEVSGKQAEQGGK